MLVAKQIEFDYGHTLPNHYGFCNQLHGHRGRVVVVVKGDIVQEGSSEGMVVDFKFLKKLLMENIHDVLDHGFAVWEKDTRPITVPLLEAEGFVRISTLDFIKGRNKKVLVTKEPPTAEYLAKWCWQQLASKLPEGVELVKIVFYETPNSWAIYRGEEE